LTFGGLCIIENISQWLALTLTWPGQHQKSIGSIRLLAKISIDDANSLAGIVSLHEVSMHIQNRKQIGGRSGQSILDGTTLPAIALPLVYLDVWVLKVNRSKMIWQMPRRDFEYLRLISDCPFR
jgi:hypothetical protein